MFVFVVVCLFFNIFICIYFIRLFVFVRFFVYFSINLSGFIKKEVIKFEWFFVFLGVVLCVF